MIRRLPPWATFRSATIAAILVGLGVAVEGPLVADQPAPQVGALTPILFDGFGLEEFEGAGSVASALRRSDVRPPTDALPIHLRVRGPSSVETVQAPMVAEIRSRIEGIDVAAGVQADRWARAEGPNRILGSFAVAAHHPRGRESLEVKTSLGQGDRAPRLTIEVGPRLERRLRRGWLLFLDGKAEAHSLRADQRGTTALANPTFDGIGMIGVTGRAGIVR